MSDDTKTKLLRIESILDAFLAKLIQLPAPSTLLLTVIICGLLVAAGWMLRELL